MKNTNKLDKFWIFIGLAFAFILIGSFLSVQLITGNAVKTTKISQSTTLLKEGKLSTKSSSETPVQRLPQPSPGDQESDVEGFAQCTRCPKEYEYRAMQGMCGGTLDDSSRYEDAGLELHCIRSDGYNDHRFTDGNYVFNLGAKAKCEGAYNWIVSYGAECPSSSTLIRLGPTSGAMIPGTNSWSPMPLVGEVEAMCQRASALPSEVDNAIMRIYITCMREKR